MGQLLAGALKNYRVQKLKRLLMRYADDRHRKIFFTDEKIFIVQEKLNKQYVRIYARSSKKVSELLLTVGKGHQKVDYYNEFARRGLEVVVRYTQIQTKPWNFVPTHKATAS